MVQSVYKLCTQMYIYMNMNTIIICNYVHTTELNWMYDTPSNEIICWHFSLECCSCFPLSPFPSLCLPQSPPTSLPPPSPSLSLLPLSPSPSLSLPPLYHQLELWSTVSAILHCSLWNVHSCRHLQLIDKCLLYLQRTTSDRVAGQCSVSYKVR